MQTPQMSEIRPKQKVIGPEKEPKKESENWRSTN